MEKPNPAPFIMFHGYTVFRQGIIHGKKGGTLKFKYRDRRGGGYDLCVILCYRGKKKKWTFSRLIGACFLGPIDGYEMNHKDRDPLNCHIDNLERNTPSQNQLHWRKDAKAKK